MKSENNTTETTKPVFKRRARVGYNFLNIKEGGSAYVKITNYREIQNKKGKTNPFWDAIDLQTGEDGMIFIDGGLKGQFANMGGPKEAIGKSFEILHKGYVEAEIDGETQEVNSYDVYELDPM